VRYTRKLAKRKCFPIEFEILAINPVGLPVDPVYCETEICIPKAGDPKVKCQIIVPDSVHLNATETGLEPNPFEIKYILWNEGRQPSTVTHAQLMMPMNMGLSIQQPPSGTIQTLNRTLKPGDTITLSWTIMVSVSKERRVPNFRVVAYTLDGRDIECSEDVPISPLSVALSCKASGPDTLRYNRLTDTYSPNPFMGVFELINGGGLFMRDVEVCVQLPPEFSFRNTNPAQDTCVVIPQIASFRSETVKWELVLNERPVVGKTVRVVVRYHSPTLGPDWFECYFDVYIEPVIAPKLVCMLDAPDTIRFEDTDYVPSTFTATLLAWNEGSGPADSVRAYLIQDTRFNIVDPRGPNRYLKDLLQPGDSVSARFLVKVNPRQVSGYDTIRAVVVGVGTAPAVCEFPIWVEKEARPVFDVSCQATPDSLVFDENLNDYVPNPLQVTMIAVNVGDTYADDCKLVFVGPPQFTPVGQDPVFDVGRMIVGQSVTHTWNMRALRRTTSGVDTMIFQIQGQGGMGERIVIGECRIPVYVPAARAAEYTLTCTAPNALQYDNGVYIPDPFLLTVDVLNSGGADGRGLKATLQLPSGVELAAGERAVKVLPDVQSQERTQVVWRLRAIARDDTSSVRLCVTVVDTLGQRGECCTDVVIPKADRAQLGLVCSAPQRLEVDPEKGEYIGNPFTVTLAVENQGALQLRNVKATILPQSSEVVILDQVEKLLALFLDPGAKAGPVEWKVQAQPRTQSGPIEIRIRVSADGLAPKECVVRIEIPELGMPLLACTSWTVPADTLHFDHSKGAYERDPFEVRLKVWNAGKSQARAVKAMVLPPTGVTLAPGESAIKELTPNTLSVSDSGFVSWMFKPVRMDEGYNRRFVFNVVSDRGAPAICAVTLFIQGAPKISTLTIPRDNVGRFGDKIQVPVYIDETIGKDIRSYRFRIQYDPTVVRLLEPISKGSMTEYGWIAPRMKRISEGVVEVESYTTGSPIPKGSGVFLYLIFEGVFGNGPDELKWAQSEIHFLEQTINEGEVITFAEDGLITVSGECIIPLQSDGTYNLAQNQPNPFNPTTTIQFSVAEDTYVRLTVHDALGREVRVLINSFKEKGAYSVRFNANDLPSGVYFYKLETKAYSKIRKMILAR
ncbi:MAG: T9SS type A sorting domain-containing protein, partial [Chlorobi bacterium]|nr:T9SS type A sorting domain-containing protein [Chlorobiota bacterium]